MAGNDKTLTAHELQRNAKLAQALRANLRRRKAADRTASTADDRPSDDKCS
jgi:hypothetical protein